MVAQILGVLPGMGYETLMNMYWEELIFWHEQAVRVYTTLHGVV
jgi:hypothetical protein